MSEGLREALSFSRRVEKSIQTTFHKRLFTPFAKAINEYELLRENDHVAVCISGGKDSFLLAKLFQELQRHRKYPFSLTFLCMDPGYAPGHRAMIEGNAGRLGIPLEVFESSIFDAVDQVEGNACYLCARMRRGYLYAKARERGCNKIALAHHFDDVIETILMGMLYGAQMQTMMPKIRSTNFEGMELIRPMYKVREAAVEDWRDENGLEFIQCACRMTQNCSAEDGTGSKRAEIKALIRHLKETNPYVESNIFNSSSNVNLHTVLAYKQDGVKHSFLEWYGRDR